MTLTDIISGVGVLLILIPFFLSTFSLIGDKSKIYFVLNFFGGALATWGSIRLGSVPFVALEGIWTLVALIGYIRTYSGGL